MATKHDAEWWRLYRARRKLRSNAAVIANAESDFEMAEETVKRAERSPAAVSAAMHGARRDKEKKAELAAMGELAGTMVRPDVHAACDKKIADLERRLAEYEQWKAAVMERGGTEAQLSATTPLQRTTQKPGFLAAPDDDCKTCTHDRHSYNHLRGPCQYPVTRKTKCLCNDYDLGFE